MTLESGPARTDRNWQLLRTVIFLGFGAYFVYDGLYGYPRANRAKAEELLKGRPFNGKVAFKDLGEKPDQPDFDRLSRSVPASRDEFHKALGGPFVDGGDEYYVSRYGYIRLPRGGEASWRPWDKTRAEITQQYYWAIIPFALALPFIWKLYKALTLRVVIDDDGLGYAGRRIAFSDMTSLRDYSPKGWIDLHYRSAGRESKLRLDNEKVARFDEIVAALCQAKGFRNEVQAYAERKARQEAEEAESAEQTEAAQGEGAGGSALEEDCSQDEK
jgi:hypothetical protein